METLRRLRREGIALSTLAGAIRATSRLLQYRSMGAIFVGSNPMFDYRMLDSTLRRHASLGLEGHGFDMATMSLIDVVRHDRMIDSDFKSRPRRGLHLLCEHYHVEPGCHRAAQDARAAGEVLLRQSAMLNQKLRDVAQDSEEVSA
jgi:DNA polymerase III alpha subunit (gram-positive type)